MTVDRVPGPPERWLSALNGRTVAVIGYGNQGQAHALNLRDSGVTTIVGHRPNSAALELAGKAGLATMPIDEAAAQADLAILALPDEAQADLWSTLIRPALRPGATVGFLHGYTVHYGLIRPPQGLGVVLIAPKGPGATLRDRYQRGQGIPCLMAIHQESAGNDARDLALAWAAGIGCARAAVLETTFRDETETDLFGEQAVLCGGMTGLIRAAFETLVEDGYPPELAYMECCQEVKQVADLVYERGLAGMMAAISNTAEFGAYAAGNIVVDDALKARLRGLLDAIRDGRFTEQMQKDFAAGSPAITAARKALASDPIEDAGRTVRSWMPWLQSDETGDQAPASHAARSND